MDYREEAMKEDFKRSVFIIILLVVSLGQSGLLFASDNPSDGPLASWVGGPDSIKQKIIDFVERVTDPQSQDFVPESDRLATFDMDGTIICEKPRSMGMVFAEEFLRSIAKESPTLSQIQPYKAALENDRKYLGPNFLQVLTTAHLGYPQSKYREEAREFVNTSNHPRFHVPYRNLVYQPMKELIAYLKSKQFSVYVVSGSWQGFVRVVGQETLGFEYSHLIGSKIGLDFQVRNGESFFLRKGESLAPDNVEKGKPENIQAHIGIKPILAFGNSNGDQQMYEFADTNHYKHLILSLDHDDAAREYKYPSAVQYKEGWLKVSMKNNFKVVFQE
jgi:phosphoserine phosphatase